jgi:two-component system, NtrC family, sensor histidine kinase HydH
MTLALAQHGQAADPWQTQASPWTPRENLLPLGYYLVVATVLAGAGFPAWRIAVVALAATVHQAHYWFWGAGRAGHCRRAEAATSCMKADAMPAWRFVRAKSSFFAVTFLTVAVTGGVESPLLVTLVTPYFAALAVLGDRRETRAMLGATALGVWLLALLPRAWTGPSLPSSVHTALVLVSILGLVALLAPVHAALRRRSEALARARDEMASEALARARSLEQVGARVAHELKNPLSAVKALVQLGARSPAEAASHERLRVVETEVARMQDILQDYLSFTRPLQDVRPQRTALGSLVADALLVLSARADHGGVQLSSLGDATVEADPRRLKEALLNLVTNAIEATPPGGEVVVEVRPSGEQAEILVRDTGRGMPPESMKRLGTPFFTTREEGTGLGVVLARSVVAQHGGTLRYESEPGKGTTVIATLPAQPVSRSRGGVRAAGG